MKRYLYLFPLMAFTAATLTLAACDENKSEDTAAVEQTTAAETPATTTDTAAVPEAAPTAVMTAEGASAYATAPGATTGAIFLTLHNPQQQPDKLVGATTIAAGSVEIHESSTDANGVMQMRKVDSIEVQPGQQIDLTPGGYHLMLMDLKAPLVAGSEFPVTLDFETAPDVTLQVVVRDAAASAADSATATEPATSGPATTSPDAMTATPTDEPAMPSADEATPEPTTEPEEIAPVTEEAPATTDPHAGH